MRGTKPNRKNFWILVLRQPPANSHCYTVVLGFGLYLYIFVFFSLFLFGQVSVREIFIELVILSAMEQVINLFLIIIFFPSFFFFVYGLLIHLWFSLAETRAHCNSVFFALFPSCFFRPQGTSLCVIISFSSKSIKTENPFRFLLKFHIFHRLKPTPTIIFALFSLLFPGGTEMHQEQ